MDQSAGQVVIVAGVNNSFIAARQPLAVARVEHGSPSCSGRAVNSLVDSPHHLGRDRRFCRERIIGRTGEFAEPFEVFSALGEVQNPDQELGGVISCRGKRFEPGDFLVESLNIKPVLGQIDAGEVNLVEDGPQDGKDRKVTWDRG